jgi:hypothetical protein
MPTSARTKATSPNRLDRLDGVRLDVCLNRDSGDSDVPADVDTDQLARAGEPVDIPGLDAEPFGYLGNSQKLAVSVHHRPPSRSEWAWIVVDWVNAAAARCALMSGFIACVFASFLWLVSVSRED